LAPVNHIDPTLVREWLVRTRAGEILGPYNQKELLTSLNDGKFTVDDEISPSQGSWVSAQVLSFRESDELTKTSTRTHQTSTTNEAMILPDAMDGDEHHHFHTHPHPQHSQPAQPHATKPAASTISSSTYILLALVILVGAIATLKVRREGRVASSRGGEMGISLTESPFLKGVYLKIQSGKQQEALRDLTRHHESGPSKTDVEYLIPYAALLITETDSTTRAVKLLQQVLETATTLDLKARAHHWLGYAMLANGEGDMGESHFLEALQMNPKDPAARFNLGRAYLKQEKFSQALDYFQLAELEVPNLWLVHIYKGRAKFSLQQTEEAKVSFKTAVASSPDRWLSYIYFALFLRQSHQKEIAQDTLKIMLRHDPMYELHSPAPWGYFQEKIDYAEYLDVFNHVMTETTGPEREIGKIYIQYLMSGKDLAKRLEALGDKPDLFGKIIALKAMLDRDASQADLKKLIAKLPANLADFGYYAYVLRGEALMRLGEEKDSQRDLTRALDLSPRAAVAQWAYASLLKKQGRQTEADQKIQELLSYHPNYIPAIVWSLKE
jgi:tetratricopeptide (TPR) repeat protein